MRHVAAIFSIFFCFIAQAQTSPRLQAEINQVLRVVDQIGPTAASMQVGLEDLLKIIPQVRINAFKKSDYAGAQSDIVPQVFSRRMRLRQRMIQLSQMNQLDEATARKIERAMRYLRGVEDYLGYVDSNQRDTVVPNKASVKYVFPVSKQTPSEQSLLPGRQTLVNGLFTGQYRQDAANLQIRSGDLLLSRGTAATSSAIARLADEDTQFSHVGLVYVDPKTQKAYTIEAHIELGVLVTPIEEWFKDGKKRTVIYRFRDREIAARAGEKMYQLVTQYQKDHGGENIPYDFGFDMHDAKQIFCSEVVRVAFDLGSGGSVQVPLYPAKLTPKNRSFLDQLGIKQTESFIPADLEIDPRFDLIAEWRSFGGMRESWVSDAITTKLYEWMDREGLKFDPPKMMEFAGNALIKMRNSKMCNFLVRKRVAPNADKETVAVMLTIVNLYSKVHKELIKREVALLASRGTPFTIFEAMAELELLRKENPTLFSKVLK